MRIAGGLSSLCVRRGGVGTLVRRSLDAAFRRAVEGSREGGAKEEVVVVGDEGHVDWKGLVGRYGVGGCEVTVGEGGKVGG